MSAVPGWVWAPKTEEGLHRSVLGRGTPLMEEGHGGAEPGSQALPGSPGEPASPLKVVSDPEALGQVILGAVRMLGNLGEQGPMGPAGLAAGGEGRCSEHRERERRGCSWGRRTWLLARCLLQSEVAGGDQGPPQS